MTVKKLKRRRIPASERRTRVEFKKRRLETRGRYRPWETENTDTTRMEDELTEALHHNGWGSS